MDWDEDWPLSLSTYEIKIRRGRRYHTMHIAVFTTVLLNVLRLLLQNRTLWFLLVTSSILNIFRIQRRNFYVIEKCSPPIWSFLIVCRCKHDPMWVFSFVFTTRSHFVLFAACMCRLAKCCDWTCIRAYSNDDCANTIFLSELRKIRRCKMKETCAFVQFVIEKWRRKKAENWKIECAAVECTCSECTVLRVKSV